jgi:hypothetical protein
MAEDTVAVFTFKSIERILAEGGTSSWRLDRNHARQATYAVLTRNAHADETEGPESHHTAFLIGKIKDVVPVGSNGRFLILFREYALIDIADAWDGGRNPVSYRSLDHFGIDPSTLEWKPMPEPKKPAPIVASPAPMPGISGLTLAEAKRGLAITFGVPPEAIEITVRG